ncbi:GNAT family acetyltransferase [Paracoccaceae bacterium GXU_MW_L88]
MNRHIRVFRESESDDLIALWHSCGLVRPMHDPRQDITRALAAPACRIIVYGSPIKGSVMVGYDGHRGWLYFLAVEPEARGDGIARAMIKAAEKWLREIGCVKMMGLAHPTNPSAQAYPALGLQEEAPIVFGRRLAVDE